MKKAPGSISYKAGSFYLVPKKHAIGKRLANWGYQDRNKTELSDRTYMPQKVWFDMHPESQSRRPYDQRAFDFNELESKLIWMAFDTPELIGMHLHDSNILGSPHVYSEAFLDAAIHWVTECRYWRCIGFSNPFFTKTQLRAHCWEDGGMQTGSVMMSQATRHALMDLERAHKRKDMGLDPNYLWDKWCPAGFADGSRHDYLPRFRHNPVIDPDGVEVAEIDVLPLSTHDQIKERYDAFISADPSRFAGCFLAPSHGRVNFDDLDDDVRQVYTTLKEAEGEKVASPDIPFQDLRSLLHLSASPTMMDQLGEAKTWADVRTLLAPTEADNNEKIDAARMLNNTRHDNVRVRNFFEEKCGFHDFMYTPDKVITGAVLAYLADLRMVCTQRPTWGPELAKAVNDAQIEAAIGGDAFRVYKLAEDLALDKRRRMWATRFAGEANEERTLDYMLENFGRRTQKEGNRGSMGTEFDREHEPIGRNVQRRVIDADRTHSLQNARKHKGKIRGKSSLSVFKGLHDSQTQSVTMFR